MAVQINADNTNQNGLDILWTDNSINESGFDVQVRLAGGSWITFGGFFGPVTSPPFGGLQGFNWPTAPSSHPQLGRSYEFRVRSYITSGSGPSATRIYSAWSKVSKARKFGDVFTAPTELVATRVGRTSIAFSWKDPSNTNNGTAFEWREAGSSTWLSLGSISNPDANSADPVPGFDPGKTFEFRIRGFRNLNKLTTPQTSVTQHTDYSNIATVSTLNEIYAFSGLGGLSGVALNFTFPVADSLSLSNVPSSLNWDANSRAITGTVDQNLLSNPFDDGLKRLDYSFTVPPSPEVTQPFYIRLVDPSSQPQIYDCGGIVGEVLAHTFYTSNPAQRLSHGVTGLPAGVTFNAITGVLSGVLTTAGNFPCRYTVNYLNGSVVEQNFSLRVLPKAGQFPVAMPAGPPIKVGLNKTLDVPLLAKFSDPDTELAYRVATSKGNMDFLLYKSHTPITTANFEKYATSGRYTDMSFHRSIPNFVIQGGGFKATGLDNDVLSIVTDPTIKNEPGLRSDPYTLAMAKLGGDPNSATSQFFVNVADNGANLDNQNGGFTVFGRISVPSRAVADTISNLPTKTYRLEVDEDDADPEDNLGSTTPFEDFPMDAETAPDTFDASKVVRVLSVTKVPVLRYQVNSVTPSNVVLASIVADKLRLKGLANGTATITIAAVDLDGNTTPLALTVISGNGIAPAPAALPMNLAARQISPTTRLRPAAAAQAEPTLSPPTQPTPILPSPEGTEATLGYTETAPIYRTLRFPYTEGLTQIVYAETLPGEAPEMLWSTADGLEHSAVVGLQPDADGTPMLTVKDHLPASETARKLFLGQ
jgi:cyclophilin family peptidyl-prolyl cis-trans isomerase